MKGVVVLYNASDRLIKGEARDLLADRGVIACAEAISQALEESGCRVAQVPMVRDVESALEPYPPSQWDVFNLGEGLEGRLFEEARIAWALEAMGYTFTGSDGDALARGTHKARSKLHLGAARVATPRWWLLRDPLEVAELIGELEFPLIVKPVAEDASAGIDCDAVVHSVRELEERVEYVVRCYRQAALVEVFVDGREFNIALWGEPPEVLPLAELDFSAFDDPYARIVSFAAKWEEDSFEYNNTPVVCPARVDPLLAERITTTAEFAWGALGCRGYARVDMRVDGEGVPQVVEVNCNPDISPDAGFYRAARAAGYGYADMAMHILEIARRQPYVLDRSGLPERWPVHIGDQWERRGL